MEFGTFSASERLPSPEKKKDSDADDDSKEKDKKSKKTNSTAALAEIATGKAVKNVRTHASNSESWWQKIKGESATNKLSDIPLLGIKKPEVQPPEKLKDTGDTSVVTGEENSPAVPNTAMPAGEIAPTNEATELRKAAQKYADERLQIADGELHEVPLNRTDSAEAAEAAATVVLLRAMHDNLHGLQDEPVQEALDAAERTTVEQIQDAAHAEESAEAKPVDFTEATEEAPVFVSEAKAVQARTEAEPHEQPSEAVAAPAEQYGGNFPPPPLPPERLYASSGPPEFPGGTPAVRRPDMVSASEALHNERVAQGRGVLVGAVLGYLIGKPRGRRQAERRMRPTQSKLEKQIKTLQESITVREQRIKAVVREKLAAVTPQKERQHFVEKVLEPAAGALLQAGATRSAESLNPSSENGPSSERSVEQNNMKPMATAAEVYSREAGAHPASNEVLIGRPDRNEVGPEAELAAARHAGEFGKLLVEAPLAAVATPLVMGAAGTKTEFADQNGERGAGGAEHENESRLLREDLKRQQEQVKERAAIIPFDKKAENFSRQELMAVASKVTVEGVSLKEMVELGRLDEPALRRVTQEFLEGGNVAAAVTRETTEKELKYERDPKLRHAAVAGSAGNSGGAAVVAKVTTLDTASQTRVESHHADSGAAASDTRIYDGSRPVPDEATLKALRNRQIATVVTTTVLVVLAVLIVIILTD